MYITILFVASLAIHLSLQIGDKCTKLGCDVNSDKLNFFIVGDWGGDSKSPFTTDIQRNLAKGLNKIGQENDVEFYISTGDHFYTTGVKNAEDSRFQTTFEDAFSKPAHQKLWHLIAGNHDYYSNISAQLAYTKKSWRWNFPKLYYTVKYYADSKPMADFVMLDTIVLCGSTANAREIAYGPEDPQAANLEWSWIEQKLNASKAPYLFLVGHYPPRSKGRHGPTTACFVDKIEHLMKKYHVTAYLAGHDHNMQHYRYTSNDGDNFNYIVAGLGAMYNYDQSNDHPAGGQSLFFYPMKNAQAPAILKETEKGGFVLASLNRTKGKFTFYNGDSTELYSFTLKPRKVINDNVQYPDFM